MTDLIERLEEDLKWMTGYDYPDQKEVSSRLTRSDLVEAISALNTVRGIEAAKRILIEWDEEVKIWRVNTYTSEGWQSGDTLPLAVEAAVAGMSQ